MRIAVFLTRGGSLQVWEQKGILLRELQIYKELENHGVHTTLITYGENSQKDFESVLGNIEVCYNNFKLPLRIYEKMIPWFHRKALQKVDLIKTNQTNGSLAALRASNIWKKPLLSRCGYLWSEFAERDFGFDAVITQKAINTENKVFSESAANVFTTQDMLNSATSRIKNMSDSYVVPNFVDTESFINDSRTAPTTDVLFIGRFENQKNLFSLLEAVRILNCSITLIGNGTLQNKVEDYLEENISAYSLIDNVPHLEISRYMQSSKIFVLPSFFEGHPKVLLEAMACGMSVVGSNAPGIRNVIDHEKTGLLCGTGSDDIKDALQRLFIDDELRAALGRNAREYIEKNCSLYTVAKMESKLMGAIVQRTNDNSEN
ncbi:MAG: glycosyltransferase family 4 protein [Dehalococcoidia bacterium]